MEMKMEKSPFHQVLLEFFPYCLQFPVTSIPRASKTKNWELLTHARQRSKRVSLVLSWPGHTCSALSPLASLQKVLNSPSRTGMHTACWQMTNTVFHVENALYSVVIIFSRVSPRAILALFYLIAVGQFGNSITHQLLMGFAFAPRKDRRHFSSVCFPKAMEVGFFLPKTWMSQAANRQYMQIFQKRIKPLLGNSSHLTSQPDTASTVRTEHPLAHESWQSNRQLNTQRYVTVTSMFRVIKERIRQRVRIELYYSV